MKTKLQQAQEDLARATKLLTKAAALLAEHALSKPKKKRKKKQQVKIKEVIQYNPQPLPLFVKKPVHMSTKGANPKIDHFKP